jgi:hypothetical protein
MMDTKNDVVENLFKEYLKELFGSLYQGEDHRIFTVPFEYFKSGFKRGHASIPEGYALIPIEPTKEMLNFGTSYLKDREPLKYIYKAMIAAAPDLKE